MAIEDKRSRENEPSAREAHLKNLETVGRGEEVDGASTGEPQTWSADHGGGVSPPTSTGSIHEEQVQEPANNWPAADEDPADSQAPSQVDDFSVPDPDGRRTFQNGDPDRD